MANTHATMTVSKENLKRFHDLHKRFEPRFTLTGFMAEILDVYEEYSKHHIQTRLKKEGGEK